MENSSHTKGGRPTKIEKSSVRLSFRLTEEEYANLQKMMFDHGLKSCTRFVKDCIFGGKVKFIAVDNSSMEIVGRLSDITALLRSIGVNHNQAVKHLHTVFGDAKAANIVKHMAASYAKIAKVLEELKPAVENVKNSDYGSQD